MRKTPYTKSDYISGKTIRAYMTSCVAEHVDTLTGEVNATALAEDACQHFDCYEHNDVPDKFFDAAEVVALRYEIKSGVRKASQPDLRWLSSMVNRMDTDWF